MQENFLPNDSEFPANDVSFLASGGSVLRKEFVKIMVIGFRQGVMSTIHTLHLLRFAAVGDWTPLVPHGNSGELMSVLRKKVLE